MTPVLPAGGPLWFPPAENADSDGLVLVGGDLSPSRLLLAYSSGIFPWYGEGQPILWWSLDPRCVLFLEKLHVPASLRRVMNSGRFSFTEDACFDRVIQACATAPRPGQDGTWITPEMAFAYYRLHRLGHAHSIEVWEDGRLVGGLYGVQTGRVFSGESMFHLADDASKAAVVHLASWLQKRGITLIDCQQTTRHMTRFGAEEVSRAAYLALLRERL
ncbi:MAG: leucyl/phenylalanyl-tRNA--protein transferase [Mailhella sp.]|nr:leucyl/phenylalanyl-tRNA--protein transferase [Desulfovibrio sp.]MBP3731426.1 leucyl/phenylalanyl-tRNA--protein transferase [Mailhella sp.]